MTKKCETRLRAKISGAVQGVGFRPFVYRLAGELELSGWVLNDTRGVVVEAEGERRTVALFAERLRAEAPTQAVVHAVEIAYLEPLGYSGFTIRSSDYAGSKTVAPLPDLATCPACREEIFDPGDRRYLYPFTNCTDCGPRFSILEELPYDRPNTTMRRFRMCRRCEAEYRDPGDRRFHAQPNACPECGPELLLTDRHTTELERGPAALERAAAELARGRILAVKGLGGFHLMVDAADDAAVARLRRRKNRYEKPLALMVRDLGEARRVVAVSEAAAALLESASAPIVLLPRAQQPGEAVSGPPRPIADEVAPGNPRLGVMLAYTPLHHLLLDRVGRPVVATSGNLSDEPIAIGNDEALERLGGIADSFLLHDRPIARQVDDSVVQPVEEGLQPLRRARGLAPLPVRVGRPLPSILAVGAQLKSTVALSLGAQVFVSQHIGNLETPESLAVFERVIADFLELYGASPETLARDLHPDYPSTRWLERPPARIPGLNDLPVVAVQHHHAHLAACLAENGVEGSALGVTWDGTGYGSDGTVWGGELLRGDAAGFERVAGLRPFRLPGSEAAVREPRRVALALLWELFGAAALERSESAPVAALSDAERGPLGKMLASGFASPWCSSVGRLFDAVAALAGIRQRTAFEGQAAMELELMANLEHRDRYPLPVVDNDRPTDGAADRPAWLLDWVPLVEAVLEDTRRNVATGIMSARFHRALAGSIAEVARRVGESRVALTGGCFQNRLLTEWTTAELRDAGFEVLTHRLLPPNDGSISFGQVAVAAARRREENE